MFNSPNSSYASPLRSNILVAQGHLFSDSPSDSRVPRTPGVKPQNSSLDQSVPLTPEGSGRISWHDSPNSSAVTVPGTPNQPAAVSVASPPLWLEGQTSPFSQGVSLRSTPTGGDQLVPSTPKDLRKRRQGLSSLTEKSSPLSPVPHSSASRHRQILCDVSSPVGLSPPSFHSSFDATLSPTVEHADTCGEDKGHLSTGSRHGNQSVDLNQSGIKLFSTSSSMGTADASSSNGQTKMPTTDLQRRYPPPSRRRLSLGRQGQRDALRRAAHHNLAFRKSGGDNSCTDSIGDSSCGSVNAQDNLQGITLEDIFFSADVSNSSVSHQDSGFSEETPSMGRILAEVEPCGATSSGCMPLLSPAGDACIIIAKPKPMEPQQSTKPIGRLPCVELEAPHTARANDGGREPEQMQRTPLDLFNNEDIFG